MVRHGMEAGGVIYAHKNAVKSKECILKDAHDV